MKGAQLSCPCVNCKSVQGLTVGTCTKDVNSGIISCPVYEEWVESFSNV